MIRLGKDLIRSTLRRLGRHIVYVPLNETTGLDLELDLPRFVSRHEAVLFDIGANVGQSIKVFRKLFPDAWIFAFEPSAGCFETLQKRFDDARLTLFHTALGSEEGELALREYEMSVLNSVLPLDPTKDNRFRDVQRVREERVAVRTVDAVREEMGHSHIDLLKIDTQGFDLDVLRGAERTLAAGAVSAVMVELNFFPMYVGQARAEQVMEFLTDRGFVLVDLYEKFRQDHCLAWCTALFARHTWGKNGEASGS